MPKKSSNPVPRNTIPKHRIPIYSTIVQLRTEHWMGVLHLCTHWSSKIDHLQRPGRTEDAEQDACGLNNFNISVWNQWWRLFHTSTQRVTRQQEREKRAREKRGGPGLTRGTARVPAVWLPPLTVEAAMILGSQGTGQHVQSQHRLRHSANRRCLEIEVDKWHREPFNFFAPRKKWAKVIAPEFSIATNQNPRKSQWDPLK